jgi:hypothetical protein
MPPRHERSQLLLAKIASNTAAGSRPLEDARRQDKQRGPKRMIGNEAIILETEGADLGIA